MSGSLFKQRRVLGARSEATPGTAESTFTAADVVFASYNPVIEPTITFDERKSPGGPGTITNHRKESTAKATFSIDLGYDGINMPQLADLLFPSCGLIKTGRIWTPKLESPDTAGTAIKTASLALWKSGKYIQLYGASGNAKFNCVAGEIASIDFEYMGLISGETDVSIVAPDYTDDVDVPKLRCGGVTNSWAGVSMCSNKMTFDMGGKVIPKKCATATSGVDFFMVGDRLPKITVDPESVKVATQDRLGKMLSEYSGPFIYQIPAAADGYVKIQADYAQLTNWKDSSDREGIQVDDAEFTLNSDPTTYDKQFSIQFYVD